MLALLCTPRRSICHLSRSLSSLSGVWKVSVAVTRGADVSTLHLPRRIRFVEDRVEVPYQPCCHGAWDLAPGDETTSGAERASLSLKCAGRELERGRWMAPSTLLFEGLYDGERIAGTITAITIDSDGEPSEKREVGNFLCTRLFTFWGPPSPKAGRETFADLAATIPISATDASAPAESRTAVRSIDGSYDGVEGYKWLDTDITRSVISTRRGARLHPGLRALDMRDWVLVSPRTFGREIGLKRHMLAHGSASRHNVLQASDPSTYGAQQEALHMLVDYLPQRFSQYYTRGSTSDGHDVMQVRIGDHVDIVPLDGLRKVGRDAPPETQLKEPPLETAARLVQEDLILMDGADAGRSSNTCREASSLRDHAQAPKKTGEYRATAACVCFSFGDLPCRIRERHTLSELHASVGDYAQHLHTLVSRAMAGLKVGAPMWRTNWTFTFTDALEPTPDR